MGKEKLMQFIRRTLPMDIETANKLIGKFNEKVVLKNDFVLKEGEVCNELYFLEDGFMRAFTYDLEGNDITTAFYSKNMFANDCISFFLRNPAKESIQALTDCKTWYIRHEDMQVNNFVIPEFRAFYRIITTGMYATFKETMLAMLHQTAEQRYENLVDSNPEIFRHAALKDIASYLGITDSTLSRIRKNF